MITKRDVARCAGVSTATVGRVINENGYVSPESRRKVEDAIKKLNYHPNRIAGNLRRNKSNVIAVLVEDLLNPYYMQLVDAMVERASEAKYVVSLFVIRNRDVRLVLDDMIANRVCGIVNLAMFTCDAKCYDIFLEAGTKLINCIDVQPPVQVDYTNGTTQAMALLAEKGCRDVAFISGLEEWLTDKDQRVRRFREKRAEFGFCCDERLVMSDVYPREKAHAVGYRQCKRLIQSGLKFDSLICLTDIMALGAIKALYDGGYRVPEDISVIGCDNLEFSSYFHPALTTINVDKTAEGRAYVDYILSEEPAGVRYIPTYLKVRDSVRK